MEKTFDVTLRVTVKIDQDKFTQDFLEGFKRYFYDFDDIEDHLEYLAQAYARGICTNNGFHEGYGNLKEMGISFKDNLNYTEVEEVDDD